MISQFGTTTDYTVFVLDDEPAVRDSLRCLLESEHYRVQTFATPTQFLDQFDAQQPACLILDLKMPEIHGLELLKRIMRHTPQLPTIVLTAFADVPSVVSAMRLGAVNLLEKPCRDDLLLDAVRDALMQAAERQVQHSCSDSLKFKIETLSAREREILDELVAGLNVKQIAEKLGTSPNTVRNQRASILEKMEAESLADLMRMVLEGRR